MIKFCLILQVIWAVWFGTTFGMQQAELRIARYYIALSITELCNEHVHGRS